MSLFSSSTASAAAASSSAATAASSSTAQPYRETSLITVTHPPFGQKQVNLSAFSALFTEILVYSQHRVETLTELEGRLLSIGSHVGSKLYAMMLLPSLASGSIEGPRLAKREIKLIQMLQFISTTFWKNVFDALERSTENANDYHIHEKDPLPNRFVSVPKDLGRFNCATFTAGIIQGVMESAGFPCDVSAHFVGTAEKNLKTVYLIKVHPEIMERLNI